MICSHSEELLNTSKFLTRHSATKSAPTDSWSATRASCWRLKL